MSTEELEKYKQLYSKFLNEMVNMHNTHLIFSKFSGRESLFKVRKQHKLMIKTQKELFKQCGAVYAESRANSKEKFAQQRVERAIKKANPGKPGRKKQNQNLT